MKPTNRTLDTCSLKELLEYLENYCYAYAHNPTKKNGEAIDTIKKYITNHYG